MHDLIDTHTHLEEINDLELALAAARAAGVVAIVAVGSDLVSNRKVLALAGEYPAFVYPALGLHPWNLGDADLAPELEFIAAHLPEAVAVGEIGLDYDKRVRQRADKARQHAALRELLRLAGAHDRPALIHSRYAWQDALDLVVEAGLEKAVFHWYTGTTSVLRQIIGRGYYVSATPAVGYHGEHARAVREVPPDRLLLETDSPVVYGRGTPAEFEARPADVLRVLKAVARLRGMEEAEMAHLTTANARRLFGLEALRRMRARPHILIVARQTLTRSFIGAQLQEEGFEVSGAATPAEAAEQLGRWGIRPALVIVDTLDLDLTGGSLGLLGAASGEAPLLLLHGAADSMSVLDWPSPLYRLARPVSVGDVVDRVKQLLGRAAGDGR